tara:strand:- start:569 stop:1093 length:525 start_codon:yes stop_codon:yes gene_type:complete
MNSMKEIRIEKITLNIGTGKPGPELDKAKILLEKISGRKPIETKTSKRIPGWKIRPGLPIGAKVTLRGKKADEVLKNLLAANDNLLSIRSFDKKGNFAFGIPEYLEIPDMQYIPEVGIIGLEIAVTLERPGFRIKRRKFMTRTIGKKHDITKQEGIDFAKKKYLIKLKEEEDEE